LVLSFDMAEASAAVVLDPLSPVVPANELTCSHCGEAFSSRNLLFRHLKETCDPSVPRSNNSGGKERVPIVIGYLGSKYHGFSSNDERDEALRPTVEGTVVAAVRRAWGDDLVLGVARSTRTDKGSHALENVVILTVRPSTREHQRCEMALRRELAGTDIWLLAPAGPPAPPSIFDKVYFAKKRVYRCFIPYCVLLDSTERGETDGAGRNCENVAGHGVEGGLWVCYIPEGSTPDDVVNILSSQGLVVSRSDVMIAKTTGHATVRMSVETAAAASRCLDGLDCEGRRLLALPSAEAQAKLRIQKRVKIAMKVLRGPPKGLRCFHNFAAENIREDHPQARRTLQHCAGGLHNDLRGCPGGPSDHWSDADFTVVTFSAQDFAPEQLRRMLGALTAYVRGAEDETYLERCFTERFVPTPVAPAEAVCLESVTFDFCSDWRVAVGVDPSSVVAVRKEIVDRISSESRLPWRDFVDRVDGGFTRSHLACELIDAAVVGDADRVVRALDAGAQVDATNKYGQTAAFVAARANHEAVLRVLASRGADLKRPANGGTTPFIATAAMGHDAMLRLLEELKGSDRLAVGSEGKTAQQYVEQGTPEPMKIECPSSPFVTAVVPRGSDHPGAGAATVDGAFDDVFLGRLTSMLSSLPVAPKDKASPTDRAYFADTEGWVTARLNAAVCAAAAALGLPDAAETIPLMRTLIYPEPGGQLPPHVDLPRSDHATGRRSTYTFILYLSDCEEGGETAILESLPGDAALAASGGVAPGERKVLATIQPRKGRLLIFPHHAPHAGLPVVDAPKVVLRGEVLPPLGWSAVGETPGSAGGS